MSLFPIYNLNANKRFTSLRVFCFNCEQTTVKPKTHKGSHKKVALLKPHSPFVIQSKITKLFKQNKSHTQKNKLSVALVVCLTIIKAI